MLSIFLNKLFSQMKLESRAAAWCHIVKFAPHRPYGTFLALAEKLVTGVLFVHLIYEKNGENCVNCRQYLLPEHITVTCILVPVPVF